MKYIATVKRVDRFIPNITYRFFITLVFNMNKKIFYTLLIIFMAVICFWGYYTLQEPALSDISISESIETLAADEIIALFQGNELQATATYTNKIIEVHGTIKEISFLNNRKTIILKSEKFKENFIICDMSPLNEKKVNSLIVGDTITLKGICKGYLLDLILLNCIPINEKQEY